MKLIKVSAPGQRDSLVVIVCHECGSKNLARETFANVEGKAYIEYYCQTCAEKLLAQNGETK